MGQLDPAVEQQLANLSDTEWSALSARVRAPDGVEGLRAAASQYLSGGALDSFVRCSDVAAFADESGQIDAGKVANYMRAAFGSPPATDTGQGNEWGQSRGENGRDAAETRHGAAKPEADTATPDNGAGAAGRAAAAIRHGERAIGAGAAGRAAAQQRHQITGKDT